MKNLEVARILYQIADLLEMQDVEFKPQAYRRAARTIESLSKPIEEVHAEGKLEELPGVGKGIAEKVAEIIETGKLRYFEKLKKSMPIDFEALLSVEGMGPKTVKLLWKKLKIKNLDDLERAAKAHKISKLPGMGLKTEQNILEHIELARSRKARTLLGYALPIAEELKERLKKSGTVNKVELAGSLRRMKETIGDLDILVTSKKPSAAADFFVNMKDVKKVLGKGTTKCSIVLQNGMHSDLRILDEKEYGSALMYFTGSKEHNIALRRIAMSKRYKLSEYGLFKGKKQIAGKTEKEVYKKLGMSFIPPEIRTNTGEIEAAIKHKLPKLIGYGDMRGDLQMHTKWSDGAQTVEQMARASKKLGHEYICISDHVSKMKIAGGMNERQLRKQMKEIGRVDKKLRGIKILKGAEVDIKADGELDVKKDALKDLDIVVASVHAKFKQTKAEMTKRLVAAMENEYVHLIGHPTGRKINLKKPCELNFEKIFDTSKRTKTYLEINSYPERLDLSDVNARAAIEHGCKLAINTDAHSEEHLKFIKLGIAVARRGWAEKKDIINAQPLKRFLKLLKK